MHNRKGCKSMIKFIIFDVDGTLTDGKLYISSDGEMLKVFNVKDGCGIKDLMLPQGLIPVIITARRSEILVKRCNELGVTELYQGCSDKLQKVKEILQKFSNKSQEIYSLEDCAYIGDDILDLPCIRAINDAGGLTGCPKDAVREVRNSVKFVSERNGGDGAVREFIEWCICADGSKERWQY